MTGEQLFALVIAVIVVIVIAFIQVDKNRKRIKRVVVDWLRSLLEAVQRQPRDSSQPADGSESGGLNEEEKSKAELERLQKLIASRKQVAWDSDISYHLWDFYKSHFRNASQRSSARLDRDGEWYDVKILRSSTSNGQNKFEFELKGARYTFVDDEENQGWCENLKYFSLFLYDDSDRCLIEVPVKIKVDKWGRRYSITSDGPKAFLAGDWINDFIHVKLKHQRLRNQEIRAQKHQDRLQEIQDLKDRFGISD